MPTLATMSVDPWILAFSAVTVIVTIFMGFWSAKRSKTASDFFVAGRSVSVGWNASAISGEYLSAASFMGVAGMVMSSGYDALWYPVCYACGYLFLLLFIAGPLRRFGAYTIPDFAEGRYDSPIFRKIAVVFVLFIGFFYTMPQMKGAGTTLAYIFPGLPYWAGVVLVGAVITLNVALGGMKGITLVQAFQYWIKMFAISVPIFVLMSVYGHYGKQLEVNGNIQHSTSNAQLSTNGIAAKNEIHFNPMEFVQTRALTMQKSTIKYPGTLGDAKAKASKFGLGHSDFFSLATPTCSLGSAVLSYSQALPRWGNSYTNFFDIQLGWPNFRLDTSKAPKPIGELNAFTFRTYAEEVFATNGVTVVALDANSTAFLLTTNLHKFVPGFAEMNLGVNESAGADTGALRKPLPEKAPADKTWIAPFGPLTTKAIKAAAAKLPADQQAAYIEKHQKPFSLLYTYSLIIALVCGTAGLPHILVRFYTNPDGVAAKRTTMWVMILIGVFYVFPPVFGVIGRNLMPELYTGLAGIKGTDQVVLKLPTLLGEKYGVLGSILSGITCAGAFAAFMSTFSGLLVSMTGALAHDVYGRILKPKSTPEQRMRMFKWCAALVGGVAVVLGCFVEPLEINFMVGQAFAIAAASYFPLLFMSVWWRGMTQKGAATGMLIGGVCALGAAALTNVSTLALDKGPMGKVFASFSPLNDFWAAHPLLRILCEQPAIWAVPLAIGLMIVISKVTQRDVPSDIRMKMLVLHAPEKLGLKQEYIEEHQSMPGH